MLNVAIQVACFLTYFSYLSKVVSNIFASENVQNCAQLFRIFAQLLPQI